MNGTTQAGTTEFYSLPAHQLRAGMSTADGQDITAVELYEDRRLVIYDTVTPGHEDGDDRCAQWDEQVDLAVFSDTEVDGRAATS